MEFLNTPAGIITLWILGSLLFSVTVYEYQKGASITEGFYEDINEYARCVRSCCDMKQLEGYEKSLRILRDEYKKHVKPEVINEACGRIQAAIQNRRQEIKLTISFVTEA